MGNPRIDELRRRVQADPASIAFAQLAEEYRRAGQFDEAVSVCRTGLVRHPGYLSARVTLGRALLELGELDDAGLELQFVVNSAPENLAAIRGLAEIHQRQGQLSTALDYYRRALALASHDPELEDVVQYISRELGRHADQHAPAGLSFEEAHDALVEAAARVPQKDGPPGGADARDAGDAATLEGEASAPAAAFDFDTLLAAMGTPPAPAPVEALLDHAVPLVAPTALPPVPDPVPGAPPDPFAALEADLRQYVPEPIASGEQGSAPPAEVVADEVAAALAGSVEGPPAHDDTSRPSPDSDVVAAPEADATPAPDVSAGADADAPPVEAEAPPVVVVAEGAADTIAHDWAPTPSAGVLGDLAPATEPDVAWSTPAELAPPEVLESMATAESEVEAPPADPVLDELEQWLAVLQERAGTAS